MEGGDLNPLIPPISAYDTYLIFEPNARQIELNNALSLNSKPGRNFSSILTKA